MKMSSPNNPVFTDNASLSGDGTSKNPLGSFVFQNTITLSSTQILKMGATGNVPVQIIPAPGTKKAAVPLFMSVEGIPGTVAYTLPLDGNGAILLYPSGQLGSNYSCPTDIAEADVGSGAGWDTLLASLCFADVVFLVGAAGPLSQIADLPWVLSTGDQNLTLQDFTAGNGTAKITILYAIVDL